MVIALLMITTDTNTNNKNNNDHFNYNNKVRSVPLQRPANVWSVSAGVLSVWTQFDLSPSFWIIPQMLISSNEHWSSRVCVLAGKDNTMKCLPKEMVQN